MQAEEKINSEYLRARFIYGDVIIAAYFVV
jgi:hypothetical protein